jgi:hypothetical protein
MHYAMNISWNGHLKYTLIMIFVGAVQQKTDPSFRKGGSGRFLLRFPFRLFPLSSLA